MRPEGRLEVGQTEEGWGWRDRDKVMGRGGGAGKWARSKVIRLCHVMKWKLYLSGTGKPLRVCHARWICSSEKPAWKCDGALMHPGLGQGAGRPLGWGAVSRVTGAATTCPSWLLLGENADPVLLGLLIFHEKSEIWIFYRKSNFKTILFQHAHSYTRWITQSVL